MATPQEDQTYWQKVQATAVYVTSNGSNIVTLTVLHILRIKNFWLCQLKAHGCLQKSPPWIQHCIYHRFQDILNQRIVTLTFNLSRSSKVKPMATLYNLCWVQHCTSCRSWHISCQKVWLWFLTPQGHPRSNLTVPIESSCVLPRIYYHFRAISSQTILMLTFDASGSSKVKFDGANQKPIGTFIYDLCWVQHHISHHWATHHLQDQPPNQRQCVLQLAIGPVCNTMYCILDLKTGSRFAMLWRPYDLVKSIWHHYSVGDHPTVWNICV